MVYIDIVVLDQCCCPKNTVTCLWIFFMNSARTWYEEGEIIHPNSSYNPVIYQRFRESKIHVVVLPLKGHKANKANQTKSNGKKMPKMASSWRMIPERGPETFL